MTCFWDGVITAFTVDEFNQVLSTDTTRKPSPVELANALKAHNLFTVEMTVNGVRLQDGHFDPQREWVSSLDLARITEYQSCGTFDPFLMLISDLFAARIEHDFNGVQVVYQNLSPKPRSIIRFRNDLGHFQFVNREPIPVVE